MARRSKGRKKLAMPEVNLTPLIDTALTLLVIFMVATPMLHNSVSIDLPKSVAKDSSGPKVEDLTIYIDKSERFYVNDKKMESEQVINHLKKITGNSKQSNTVFVKADTSVRHGTVCEFVDKLKHLSGVKNVALVTQAT